MLVSTCIKTIHQTETNMYFLFSQTFVRRHSYFQVKLPDASLNKKGQSKNAQCNANMKATIKLDKVPPRKKKIHLLSLFILKCINFCV